MAIEKIKIPGAVLELPAKQQCQSSPFTSKLGQIGQICSAPRILIFSIAMGAEYLFYLKSIATFALTFYGYIILVLASVRERKLLRLSDDCGLTLWPGHSAVPACMQINVLCNFILICVICKELNSMLSF